MEEKNLQPVRYNKVIAVFCLLLISILVNVIVVAVYKDINRKQKLDYDEKWTKLLIFQDTFLNKSSEYNEFNVQTFLPDGLALDVIFRYDNVVIKDNQKTSYVLNRYQEFFIRDIIKVGLRNIPLEQWSGHISEIPDN